MPLDSDKYRAQHIQNLQLRAKHNRLITDHENKYDGNFTRIVEDHEIPPRVLAKNINKMRQLFYDNMKQIVNATALSRIIDSISPDDITFVNQTFPKFKHDFENTYRRDLVTR